MATKHKNLDYGGLNLIVGGIKTASKPWTNGTTVIDSSGNVAVASAKTLSVGTAVITGPAGAATAAGTGSGSAGNTGGAVATHVLPIVINGTTYYIPLCNTNA